MTTHSLPNTVAIVDYTPKDSASRYAGTVAALVDAGPGKAARILVPKGGKLGKNNNDLNGDKHKREFAAAANAQGLTAKLVDSEDRPNELAFTFTLVPFRARKPKSD